VDALGNPQAAGSIGLRERGGGEGGLILALDTGIWLSDSPTESFAAPDVQSELRLSEFVGSPLRDAGLDVGLLRLNDGRVDAQGRFVCGAYHTEHGSFVDAAGNVDAAMPRGGVYRVCADLTIETLSSLGRVRVSNGAAFAAPEHDGATLGGGGGGEGVSTMMLLLLLLLLVSLVLVLLLAIVLLAAPCCSYCSC